MTPELPTHRTLAHDEPTDPATVLARVFLHEDINFLVTNRLPRQLVTRAVGRASHIRSKTFTRAAIAFWRLFADDLRLEESAESEFSSLHDCFVRQLKPGARPVDAHPRHLVSPCDAIIGASGAVSEATAIQAKGFPYPLLDLLHDPALVARHADSTYVTLRLKANMYHRFHAPAAGRLTRVTYISGDTWNVNPIALRRVERLFCKNERAVLDFVTPDGAPSYTLVPVAAIAVASIRLHALDQTFSLRYRGADRFECDVPYARGDELGYFHAGSTILLFADSRFRLADSVREGAVIRMGEPLLVDTHGEST